MEQEDDDDCGDPLAYSGLPAGLPAEVSCDFPISQETVAQALWEYNAKGKDTFEDPMDLSQELPGDQKMMLKDFFVADNDLLVNFDEVRRCKLDPRLKAPPPRFQTLMLKRIAMLFNLNLVSELAALQRGGS